MLRICCNHRFYDLKIFGFFGEEDVDATAAITLAAGVKWKKIIYERVPKFCSHCMLLGHDKERCIPWTGPRLNSNRIKQVFTIKRPLGPCSRFCFNYGECALTGLPPYGQQALLL